MELPPAISELPIQAVLPQLQASLAVDPTLILRAPPGAGKTTAVPLLLLASNWFDQQMLILLQPRRLAVRRSAARIAGLLGQPVGETVGYRVRGERREGKTTRLLVVTEGIFVRMLQNDPELAGVGAVILDEFHERSLDMDLSLALLQHAREIFRPELRLIVMSATLDVVALAALLDGAPVIESEGFSFPVETAHNEIAMSVPDLRLPIELLAQKILAIVQRESGGVLVFLPGVGEIKQLAERLSGQLKTSTHQSLQTLEVSQLYGELDNQGQSRALRPAPAGRRKLVLTTNVAETSLTIEGVRVVIDCGLMREMRFHPGSGTNRLQTVYISRDSADQRRGRAGRTEAGICYRLWSAQRDARLDPHRRAEILHSDLARLLLELANWGVHDVAELKWMDLPPAASVASARQQLRQLQAVDNTNRITAHGARVLALGIEPRLAHMILTGYRLGQLQRACRIASLLSESSRGLRRYGVDLAAAVDNFAAASGMQKQIYSQLLKRAKAAFDSHKQDQSNISAAALLAFAYPDRIAKARNPGAQSGGRFLLSSGRGVMVAAEHSLASAAFLVVAQLNDRDREGRVQQAMAIEESELRQYHNHLIATRHGVVWSKAEQRVIAEQREELGAILLQARTRRNPPVDAVNAALLSGIRETGIASLPWKPAVRQFQARLIFLSAHCCDNPPFAAANGIDNLVDISDAALLANLEIWLLPWLSGETTLARLGQLDLLTILRAQYSHQTLQAIEKLVPSTLQVPSGSVIVIEYDSRPHIKVRLQEMFGSQQTPSICNGAVALQIHLLSPANRPLQITADLAGFWTSSYQDVRRDMRGRYPKHQWPEDPLQAQASKKTKKQLQRDGADPRS